YNIDMPLGITTRKMRAGEFEGVDYHFISRETFDHWKQTGLFIEATTYRNECYGLLKSEVTSALDKGSDLLLILAAEGLETFERLFPEQVVSIFIAPPSLEDLNDRRQKRGQTATQVEDIFGEYRPYNFTVTNEHIPSACREVCLIRGQFAQPRRILNGKIG
ncbi:MAG: guanylate kinase, partial [Candidatus Liberibacter ctenarytainae]|nr:guanylate kinase [Candidatus Liberibacter ctenarytainae]